MDRGAVTMRLSKSTLFVGAYIIASAYFMQQVWSAAKKTFGVKVLLASFVAVSILAFCLILYRSVRAGARPTKMISMVVVCAAAFIFAWRQPYITEKTHILEYGLLAWLAMRDLSRDRGNLLKSALFAFLFILIVGSLDEGFQRLIPWRVGEIRDVITNLVSGFLGIIIYMLG